MPRERKPARLWLEPAKHYPDGRLKQNAVWIIRDGNVRSSTGCGAGERSQAEEALRNYLASRHVAEAQVVREKSAAESSVADVIRRYAEIRGPEVARPDELGARLEKLLAWWGDKTLDHVNELSCRAYVRDRVFVAAARRELEDLQSAITRYQRLGECRQEVKVTLPEKPAARVDFFTRDDVAKLLRFLWRTREIQHGHETARFPLRHIVPFVLAAVYTGTRAKRIWNASFAREEGRPWIDVDGGVFYRAAQGEKVSKTKRADSIRLPPRLLSHLRRIKQGPLVDGERRPRSYLVEYRGRPADPKKGLAKAMVSVFGEDHPYVRHTFRHTCATWLMWSGADINEIARYLSMTREILTSVYGHDHPESDKNVGLAFHRRAGRHRNDH